MKTQIALLIILVPTPTLAAEVIPGPVDAEVIRVIDGDTVEIRAKPWLDLAITTRVRVSGVDTPEKGGRAKCAGEASLAERASAFTRAALPEGSAVKISQVEPDKYGGRVVAKLQAPDGRDIGAALIQAKFAYPYDGGTKRSWCK